MLCNKGRRQSPINIEPDKLLFDPNLRPISVDKHKVSGMQMRSRDTAGAILDALVRVISALGAAIGVNLNEISLEFLFQVFPHIKRFNGIWSDKVNKVHRMAAYPGRKVRYLTRPSGRQPKNGGAWCDLHLPFFTQADRRRTRRDDLLSAPPVFLFQEFHKFQNWRSRKSAERNGSTSGALVRKWIELIELSRISAIISVRYAAVYANDARWIFLKKSQNWNLRFVQFFWKSISAIGLRRRWPISAEWPYFLPTLWRWFSLETHTHTEPFIIVIRWPESNPPRSNCPQHKATCADSLIQVR